MNAWINNCKRNITISYITDLYLCTITLKYIFLKYTSYFLFCKCIYLPTPPQEQDVTQNQSFKLKVAGLNSEFSSYSIRMLKS